MFDRDDEKLQNIYFLKNNDILSHIKIDYKYIIILKNGD